MIRLPQRSVTRFFIPLIDVLTLLFCMFLLLPVIQSPGGEADTGRQAREDRLRELEQEVERLKAAGADLPREKQEQLAELRRQTGKALQERLAVRVLEIDPQTGRLFYRDPEHAEVASQADARALIDRDRRDRAAGRRELYYVILYPRDPASSYPTRGQREKYDRWLEGVALGYDIPGR
jgi:hypothetical protein